MRIVLLGAPGAGKGTQAQFLAKHYKIPMIATGEILRDAIKRRTILGRKAKKAILSGRLVPSKIVIPIIEKRLRKEDCENGYLLDGFPRTLSQAKFLSKSDLEVDFVVEIKVKNREIMHRITGRLIHPGSGRVYHKTYNPPKVPNKDDVTGETLTVRKDDTSRTVRRRLKVYHRQTVPLIRYYKKLQKKKERPHFVSVDGTGKLNEISKNIVSALTKASSGETSSTRRKKKRILTIFSRQSKNKSTPK